MKKLGVLFCLLLALSGCNPNGTAQHSCTLSVDTDNMKEDVNIIIFGTEEHVDKVKATIAMDTHLLGEGIADEVYREVEYILGGFDDVEGITVTMTLDGDIITVQETVDYNKVSDSNTDVLGMEIKKNVTMGEAMKAYEEFGLTCH